MKPKLFFPAIRVRRPAEVRVARFLLPGLLILIALILVSSQADAHGSGYYQIRGAHIDPYAVHVWVAPGMLRTGDVHIDTVVLDSEGKPALGTLVQVSVIPLETEGLPISSLVGAPGPEYPYSRGATFTIDTPGKYRLEVALSDTNGVSGITSADVEVMTIGWGPKLFILTILIGSAATGVWLLLLTRAFWLVRVTNRKAKLQHLHIRSLSTKSYLKGGAFSMQETENLTFNERMNLFIQRLNGPYHAPALWGFMLIIVAHWLEHVLQIYQIYAMGWAPSEAGGILGVIYPQLVESEVLHFVYDFIQWAGIVILLSGFFGHARLWWTIAMVVQTWHYIEHVLLMGQYLTGYYFFGAAKQTSLLQYWFPRAELHFVYNLLVFIPMVIAVHYYVRPKLQMLHSLNNSATEAEAKSEEQA